MTLAIGFSQTFEKNYKTFKFKTELSKVFVLRSKKFNSLKTTFISHHLDNLSQLAQSNNFNERYYTIKYHTFKKVHSQNLNVGFIDPKISSKNDLYISFKSYQIQGVPHIDLIISKYDLAKNEITSFDKDGVIYIPKINLAKFFAPIIEVKSERNSCLKDIQYFLSEFNRTRKRIYSFSKKNISKVEISNNCREPGNLEIGIFNQGKKVTYGYAHIPYSIFSKHIKTWYQKYPHEMGIHSLRVAFPSYGPTGALHNYSYSDIKLKDKSSTIPECNIYNVNDETDGTIITESQGSLGEENFKFINGKIPFDDLPKEVQKKSAFKRLDRNSYMFIKVNKKHAPKSFLARGNPKYPLPQSYLVHKNGLWSKEVVAKSFLNKVKDAKKFWDLALKSEKEIYLPHRFRAYEEMFGYFLKDKFIAGYWDSKDPNILPSSFEVDGRYGAELKIDHFQAARLWKLDFNFIRNINYHKSRVHYSRVKKEKVFSTDLLCLKKCFGKVQNIAIRNILLKPGERKEILLGIGVEPLEIDYTHQSKIQDLVYALTYNNDGTITNHNPEIGKIVLTRGKNLGDKKNSNTYTIDIITDDRIHPLARYQIKINH